MTSSRNSPTSQDLESNQHGIAVIGDAGAMLHGITPGPPPDQPWPSDIAASSHELDGLQVRAASMRGLLHRAPNNSEPRQDAYGVAYEETSHTLAAVVCDGVGSLKYSHVAAAYVCRVLPWKYLACRSWSQAIAETNRELAELELTSAKELTDGKRAMATTVVAVAVTRSELGNDLHIASVGDSEAWELAPGAVWNRRMPPPVDRNVDEGGIATGKTKALPAGRPIVSEAQGTITHGAMFLMTDGVGTPLAMNTEVQQRLAEWWQEPPDPITFARQTGFARRTFVDDRTVLGIWFTQVDHSESGVVSEAEQTVAESSSNGLWEGGELLSSDGLETDRFAACPGQTCRGT